MTPRRTLGPVVLCAALAATLGGCGGSSKGSPVTKTSPSPTAAPLTAATAKALAAAGVLTKADLPGYTTAAQEHDASDDQTDAALAACLGVPTPTYLARDFGTAFTKGELEIDSSVDIATTAAAAKDELTAYTSAKAPTCVKQTLTAVLAKSGITVTSFTATPQPVTVSGSDTSFGYALTLAGTTQGQTINLSGYEAGALVGQAEVSLSTIASSQDAITLPQVTALLTTAVGRVRAAS